MRATLEALGSQHVTGRRIAVLGAMRELGAESVEFHAGLADPIEAAGIDYALLVGEEMQPLAEALVGRVQLKHVPDAGAAIDALSGSVEPGDAILVKGSNAVGLAALVDALAGGKS
jgi:UDP-N-acetylmuramoyl-tripeptide--D-alanyl-D-alanine ligase